MRFTLPVVALAALASPLAAASQAGEETVTVRIAYADVDVNTAEGRAIIEQRIEAQLEKACTIEKNSRYGFGRDIVDDACIADARAEALAAVERVAANEARSGREVAAN